MNEVKSIFLSKTFWVTGVAPIVAAIVLRTVTTKGIK